MEVKLKISPRLAELLTQFLHTDNLATHNPIFIVQSREGNEWRNAAYMFSLEEARRYIAYQRHNLTDPRVFAESPGYSNDGDWDPFYEFLQATAMKCEEQLSAAHKQSTRSIQNEDDTTDISISHLTFGEIKPRITRLFEQFSNSSKGNQ